jgi:hypothetical protein
MNVLIWDIGGDLVHYHTRLYCEHVGEQLYTFALLGSLVESRYSKEWLNVGPTRIFPPNMNIEISKGRKIALSQIYQDRATLDEVDEGFIDFSTSTERFRGYDGVRGKEFMQPYTWSENKRQSKPQHP